MVKYRRSHEVNLVPSHVVAKGTALRRSQCTGWEDALPAAARGWMSGVGGMKGDLGGNERYTNSIGARVTRTMVDKKLGVPHFCGSLRKKVDT